VLVQRCHRRPTTRRRTPAGEVARARRSTRPHLLRSRASSALIARPQTRQEHAIDDDTKRRYAQDEAKLGRVVRELREERGLTDRELADSIRGISLKGIRAIEAGEYKALTYERMVRLARALGVELGTLFRRSEGLSAD